MGRVKGKHISIYVTAGFKATWDKYLEICERDGTTAARELRKYVAAQVIRRAPGNPQPPLTAFIEGHPDVATMAWSSTIKDLVARAERHGGDLTHTFIRATLKDQGLKGRALVTRTESMISNLKRLGVKIWR